MRTHGFRCCAVVVVCAFLFLGSTLNAQLILNGSFEDPGPTDPTIFNGSGPGGNSAALHWTVFNNTNGSTETEQMLYSEANLPPIFANDPGAGGDHVIRVETTGNGNGIVQVFGQPGGPLLASGEAWVYANSGVVGIGIGNGGSTFSTAFTQFTGQWEKLTFQQSTTPVNEITIYAIDGPAEFYVDLVSVSAVPEPASAGVLGLFATTAFGFRRRRKK